MTHVWTKNLSLWALILGLPACNALPWQKKSEYPSHTAPPMARQTQAKESPEPTATDWDANGKPISPGTAGLGVAITDLPVDDTGLANTDELIQQLGLESYHQAGFHGQGLKIAVLDNGFAGLKYSINSRLPPTTRLLDSPLPEMQPTSHGVKLAEIAYAMATGSATYQTQLEGPEILLLNANGYTNFVAAIDQVIQEEVDIVLYAQVWEYGGNVDGGGFINRQVERALAAGILWVNAAGNFGQGTWSGAISLDQQSNVKLPYSTNSDKSSSPTYARFVVTQPATPVKIVLAWNDFDDSKDYRTPQDLDLILETVDGTEIAGARLIQDGHTDPATSALHSAHAREVLQLVMNPGTYHLRVAAKSTNFDAHSRLRLTVDGGGVSMVDQTSVDTVLIPADNPRVLTIGAADVSYSGQQVREGQLIKPELKVVSEVRFMNGASHQGTSAATALAVGALAVFRSAYGAVRRAEILELAQQGILSPGVDSKNTAATAWLLKLTDFSSLH